MTRLSLEGGMAAGAFLRGRCPRRCSGFPHAKDLKMRQTGNCAWEFGEIWACLSLRDPAINWQLGVTLPSTQGNCGGFRQPHHPECRRSGDRMKKEWMDGCQLITFKYQMFFSHNNAACIYCSLRTPKVLLCSYCGSLKLTFEWWDNGDCCTWQFFRCD